MRTATYRHVDELRVQHDARKDAIRARLEDFAAVPPDEYFYELVYCLLTPQSSAVNAGRAVDTLRLLDIRSQQLPVHEILFRKEHYIRFHNTKARRVNEMKERFDGIMKHLCNGSSAPALREWLVSNVKGLGWKEASHFLRNIGHRDLAILDRHILKNLTKHNVVRSIPTTLTQKRYLGIEKKFRRFAADIGISMDELDLLFWSTETGEILK